MEKRILLGLFILLVLGNLSFMKAATKLALHGRLGFDLNFNKIDGSGRDLSQLRSRAHKAFLNLNTSLYGFNLGFDLQWDSDQKLSTQKYYNTGIVLTRRDITLGIWDFSASSLVQSNLIISPRKITGLGIGYALSPKFKVKLMGGQTMRKTEGQYDTTGHYLQSTGTYGQKIFLAGLEGTPVKSLTLAFHTLYGYDESKSITYAYFYYDANWALDLIANYKFRELGFLNLEIARTDIKKHYTDYMSLTNQKKEKLTSQYCYNLESGLSFHKQNAGFKIYQYDNGFKSLGNMYQNNDMKGIDLKGSGAGWKNRIIYSWQARQYIRDLTQNSDQQKKYINVFSSLDFRPHPNWGLSVNYSLNNSQNSLDSSQIGAMDMTFSNLYFRLMMKKVFTGFALQFTPYYRLNNLKNKLNRTGDTETAGQGISNLLTIRKVHQIDFRIEYSKTLYPQQHKSFSTLTTALNLRSQLIQNRLSVFMNGTMMKYNGQGYYGTSLKKSVELILQLQMQRYGELSMGAVLGDFNNDDNPLQDYQYKGLKCNYVKNF